MNPSRSIFSTALRTAPGSDLLRSAQTLLLMLGLLAWAGPSLRADGAMIPSDLTWRQMRERSYINEPAQKAVVLFHQGTEDLIISPSYEGQPESFAWLVPVPARPHVKPGAKPVVSDPGEPQPFGVSGVCGQANEAVHPVSLRTFDREAP